MIQFLRLVMAARGHAGLLRHTGAVTLVALHIILVCQSLLGVQRHVGHVVAGHVLVLGHAWAASRRRDMGAGLFG